MFKKATDLLDEMVMMKIASDLGGEDKDLVVKKTYTIEGSKDIVDKFDNVLAIINYLSSVGSTRTISLEVDGDGSCNLKVHPNEPFDTQEDFSKLTSSGSDIKISLS